MRRRFLLALIIIFTLIVFWIQWSSNREFHDTISYMHQIRSNYYPIKDLLIQPANEYCDDSPLFIILITSYVGHVELRSVHRRAMSRDKLDALNVRRIFLLAQIPPHERYIQQEAIKDEHEIFGDILQGSFEEHYRNLTYKHIMGLQWVANMCQKTSFVLKADDDTVFNFNKTYAFIHTLSKTNFDRSSFMMGYILNNTLPRRAKQNKWYVTWEEYPKSYYPPYLSGWYYITTPKTADRICNEAIQHQYFWIDDIFITGMIVEHLNIKLQHVPEGFWLEYYELVECCLKDVMNKLLQCDYIVGPNGGRNNLILEFNEIISKCELNEKCKKRAKSQDIYKNCVVSKSREIFGSGKPAVESIGL